MTTVSKNLDKTDRLLDENVKVEAAELALQDLQAGDYIWQFMIFANLGELN